MASPFKARKDGAISVVSTAPSPATSGTSLSVNAGEGSRFPAPATDGSFYASVWPAGTIWTPDNGEIVLCSARTGDNWGTIVRAQFGFGPRAIVAGDNICAGIVSDALTQIENRLLGVGAISPTALAADVNNWAPTGYALGVNLIRASAATSVRIITGLTGGFDGRIVTIMNVAGIDLAFAYESASSTAANRFVFGSALTLLLRTNQVVTLIYDGTLSRWKLLSFAEHTHATGDGGQVPLTGITGLFDATLPATIAVGGAGTAGTSGIAAERDHNHPAPATWNATFDATNPSTITEGAAAVVGSASAAAHRDHAHPTAATWTPTAHDSSKHTDAVAWTTFSYANGIVTSESGTLTTCTAAGAYQLLGKTLHFRIAITITTKNTGAGRLIFPLPASKVATGIEALAGLHSNNKSVNAVISSASCYISLADGTTPITANGDVVYITGVTEVN